MTIEQTSASSSHFFHSTLKIVAEPKTSRPFEWRFARMSCFFMAENTWSVNLPSGMRRMCSSKEGGLPMSCGTLAME